MAIALNSPRYARKGGDYDCYIYNALVGKIIPFIFSPSSLSDSLSVSLGMEQIPGASAPVITYSGTGARKVSLSILVSIDYVPLGFNNTEDYINAFRELVYPIYGNRHNVITPRATLHLTNLEIQGVCDSVNVTYKVGEDGRYGKDGAVAAEVALTFTEVRNSSPSVSGNLFTNTLLDNEKIYYVEKSTYKALVKEDTNKFNWGEFVLKGDSYVTTTFKMYRYNSPYENSQFIPHYVDEGYNTQSGDYSIVLFYYVSNISIDFTGDDIKGEKADEKSATYKICINGETYTESNRVLIRNSLPELTYNKIKEMGNDSIYYYYIYVPYVGLNKYYFDRAKIRTVVCEGGV